MDKSLFEQKIRRCNRCDMPETSQLISFDEFNICKACRSSEQKMHFDWNKREKKLVELLDHFKSKSGDNYDCIIPISGGKDSAFQLYLLTKVYDLKPLAVTYSHNWYTKTGRDNLKNMVERLNVDLIEFTPNRKLVNSLSKESLKKIGDVCWHCHTGVDAFPLQAAVRFNIPLLIYGESVAETSGKETYLDKSDYTIDYFLKFSSLVSPYEMVKGDVSKKDLNLFNWPSQKDLDRVGVTRIHLGDFIFWDAERQTEFVRDFLGWKEDHVEGTYKKYKSVECIMPGVHDYTKYLKRGFGRGTDFAIQDVRSGLLNKVDAKKISDEFDSEEPEILKYYLKISNYTKDQFSKIITSHRKNNARLLPNTNNMTSETRFPKSESVVEYVKDFDLKKSWEEKIDNIQFRRIWPNLNKNKNFKCETKISISKINDPHMLSIDATMEAYRNKNLSVHDVALSTINHIKLNEPYLNAWETIDYENILNQAKYIDQNINNSEIKYFYGLMVGIKDIFNTSDMMTQMGSEAWKNFSPGNDARIIHNLRKYSNIIAGKTKTAEFGIHAAPNSKNPHNTNYLPGTSSAGSAVAVASRMVPIALGSQTAGSTIRPSSYCGIFGMKPTFGTIPRVGVLKTSDSLDHITFMTNSINDLDIAFETLRVRGSNYPLVNKFIDNGKNNYVNLSKIKIGFVKTHTWDNTEVYTRENINNFLNKLSNNNLNVKEINLPVLFNESHNIHQNIYTKSLSYYFREEFDNKKEMLRASTRKMIEEGNNISNEEYYKNINKQNTMVTELDRIFNDYDILISHSTAGIAPKKNNNLEKNDPCLIWSMSHVPSINIPEFMFNNMPLGLQFIAKRFNDKYLLNFLKEISNKGIIKKISPLPMQLNKYSE